MPSLKAVGAVVRDEEDEDADDEGFPQYLEELFLGTVVYPQDKNEVQLTSGYFNGLTQSDESLAFFEVEYGITDRLQVGIQLPFGFAREEEELADGMRTFGTELYYNFYRNSQTGRAYGVGFELGIPLDSPADETGNWVYEPFFVALQDFGGWAANFSAAVEVENPVLAEEATETAGELAFAVFGPVGKVVPILELDMVLARHEVPVRFAPGFYAKAFNIVDVGISAPIGITDDAPAIGVFLMAIVEFDAKDLTGNPRLASPGSLRPR